MKTASSPDIILRQTADYRLVGELTEFLKTRTQCSVKNVFGSLKALLIVQLWRRRNSPILVVCPDTDSAGEWYDDIRLLVGEDSVCFFAEQRKSLAISAEQLDAQLIDYTGALSGISESRNLIVIASADSLNFLVPAPKDVRNNLVILRRGEILSFSEFTSLLQMNGFDRKDFVESIGDMAIRGGLVDVFPPGVSNPIRCEFFGDELDSIREFDRYSQRSIREIAEVSIITHLFHNDDSTRQSTLLDYLPPETLAVLYSPESIDIEIRKTQENNPEIQPVEFEKGELRTKSKKLPTLLINPLGNTDFSADSQSQPAFQSSIAKLCHELRRLTLHGFSFVLSADGAEQLRRLHELVENCLETVEDAIDDEPLASPEKTLEKITMLPFALSDGFVLPERKLAVFAEHQIFMRHKAGHSPKRAPKGFSEREFQQLRSGDYVVHSDKGIAIFDGLETITMGGSKQECARLLFAGGDKMYVSLTHINRLQKYSAQEGSAPTLSKLGSSEWERKKARTKKRLKDIARDLIRLYSSRKSQPGYAFPADTMWQKEMEASFMYEDTPDQATATFEVKTDMENHSPMDRLVCGDVGFGKTEVAVRAAFKAVQAGKQVAVLVPTTILAEQHYSTFHDRLHRYAVNVNALSRFRTKAEQTEILRKTEKGTTDILIGTHRILSKDVKFKDLGLLIVDEEQRFGVGAKEKLRQARVSVDTLTLTATPIPRTLNFSLMGARDLSVIETPPRNRIPIQTEILAWDDKMIAAALTLEFSRGGQAYFVSDRIADLSVIADKLRELFPKIRLATAHGGITGEELENIMEKFIERKIDVLVATKIIESGIDIPNVNTMFINRADKFGLAELYQLRGRVGRSNIQAYCYLLIPDVKSIARTALRRLQAIEEFTELGSGFNLAMRDLEIRGAGNLLGAEQSGFIMEMGFELYQKILDEAVQELKHEEFSELFADRDKSSSTELVQNDDVTVEIEGDALLPKSYIESDAERYEFYKKLYRACDELEYRVIYSEMRDRFGVPPEAVELLCDAIRLRIAAIQTGLASVSVKKGVMEAEFPSQDKVEFYEQIFEAMMAAVLSIPTIQLIPQGKKVFFRCNAYSIDSAIETLNHLVDLTKQILEQKV